jgi:hypothetical protein
MAILLSVTVSIAEDIMGTLRFKSAILTEVTTSFGFTLEKPGERRTSSKVIEYLEIIL